MATAWAVVAMVQGSSGLVWLQGVSWLQLWTAVATSQGAGTNKIGLSIVVAAWDSRRYGTRIEQAGSDIFHIKLKNQKKKFEILKIPHSTHPSIRQSSVWPAAQRVWGGLLLMRLSLSIIHLIFPRFFFLIADQNQKHQQKKFENLKIPSPSILRLGNPHRTTAWDSCW